MKDDTKSHSTENCWCDHAPDDHDSGTSEVHLLSARPGSLLQATPICSRCDHAREIRTESDEYLAKYGQVLADQSERFIGQFQIDVSDAETFSYESVPLLTVADAYERIALAQQRVDPAAWYQAAHVDGRSAKDIMDRLWDVREELRRRESVRTEAN
jgi:hypothetical protein